jgi:adenosylhomocysteine nucleosidase
VSRIAVLTATRWEFNAVALALTRPVTRAIRGVSCLEGRCGANQILLAQTGVGPAAAARAASSVLSASPVDLVLSAGYACLLTAGEIGDVMTATEVAALSSISPVTGDAPRRCDDRFRTVAAQAVENRGGRVHIGRLVSNSRVAVTADEKRMVAAATGAIGLDMESAAIAKVAAERRIPMGVLRVASDLLDEDLPLDFNECFGLLGWVRAAALCLRCPSRLGDLMTFRRHVAAATGSLRGVCREVLGCAEAAGQPRAAARSAEC